MDELMLLHDEPIFLRREALEHGYRDRDLRAALRDGVLVRVRHGAYVDAGAWRSADEVERFRLRGRAVLLTHPHVALSHTSAAAEHGLRLHGADLGRVHVTRLDGDTGTPTGDLVYHHGTLGDDEVVRAGEVRLVVHVRAAVETALVSSVETGVCCLDSVLDPRAGLPAGPAVTLAEVYEVARRFTRWPGAQRLQISVRLARVGAQSIGESRSRVMCWCHHLPEPVLQYVVRDGDRVVAVCDFAWPEHRLLGEFDGKRKYLRPYTPGDDAGEVVFAEKRREDLVRALTGFGMVRWTWSDLAEGRQARTAAYIRSRLA